ncbi:unnamed protein product [Blepharisma stoltei]|uniref:Uncharacterized protein n=1 Tax=Blepharisma stoltei TaxID=1481888 RepID=A0AAU9J978_9CILI|nr:unnamed protein product [Blepharisma stoltei]
MSIEKLRQDMIDIQRENENLKKIAYLKAIEELEQVKAENKRLRSELQFLSSPTHKQVILNSNQELDPTQDYRGRAYSKSSLASPIVKSKSSKLLPLLEHSDSAYKLELPPIHSKTLKNSASYSPQPQLSPLMKDKRAILQESKRIIKPKPSIKYNSTTNEELENAKLAKMRRETFKHIAAEKFSLVNRHYNNIDQYNKTPEEDVDFERYGDINGNFGSPNQKFINIIDKNDPEIAVERKIYAKKDTLNSDSLEMDFRDKKTQKSEENPEEKKTPRKDEIEVKPGKEGIDMRKYDDLMKKDEKALQEAKELIKNIELRQKQQLENLKIIEDDKKRKEEADKTQQIVVKPKNNARRKNTYKILYEQT